MIRQGTRWAVVFVACTALFACEEAERDDNFARGFLRQWQANDSAAARLLDPSSSIRWVKLASMRQHLPSTGIDSLRLVAWDSDSDSAGAYRKLTYHAIGGAQYSLLEMWLTTTDGRTHVNTFQASGPLTGGR